MTTPTTQPPVQPLVVRAAFDRNRAGRPANAKTGWRARTSCGGPLDGLVVTAGTYPRASAALAAKIWSAVQTGRARSEDVHPGELGALTVLAVRETFYSGSIDAPALRIPADAARGRRGGWFLQVVDFAGPLAGIVATGATLPRARAALIAAVRAEIAAGRVDAVHPEFAAPLLLQHTERRTYTAAVLHRLAAVA